MKQYKNKLTGIIYNLVDSDVFKMSFDDDKNLIIKNEFILIEDADDWTMIVVKKNMFQEWFIECMN